MTVVNCLAVKRLDEDFEPTHDILSRIVTDFHIEEHFLVEYLSRINQWMDKNSSLYWLMLCRLNEAALLSAGYYADCGEFSAAGDLLVNPREIFIHIAGEAVATKKKRHGLISDQFNYHKQSLSDFKHWFGRNAVIEETQPPLISFLYEKLNASGLISETYLKECDTRMKKIADTIKFLATWGIHNFEDVVNRRIQCNKKELQFMEENLCRFETDLFKRIDYEMRQISNNSNFLSHILLCH